MKAPPMPLLKTQNLYPSLRILLLAATFAGAVVVLGKSIFSPPTASNTYKPYTFPQTVPLKDWQFVASKPLSNLPVSPKSSPDDTSKIPYDVSLASQEYRYLRDGLPLTIEMRYIVGTLGDLKNFIRNYTSIRLDSKQSDDRKLFESIRYQKGVGFYGLFTHQQRAYLSSCINSRGESTVTFEQFLANRNQHDIRWHRFLPVLVGQESLRDRRCLWAHLSVPLNSSSPEQSYQILENAWAIWYSVKDLSFPKI
ncbi:MAG: cyanoexosortase A system-associated protein [Leptolyngbyaceae bacterium]|nr:cyanoexosortase A system-associated protein [Leptolyngbyaceae bacterium]